MPGRNSLSVEPNNSSVLFDDFLGRSGDPDPLAPQDYELLFTKNSSSGKPISLHFGPKPRYWLMRLFSRLRARSDLAKLIDAQFGDEEIIVTKRWIFPDETLGDRLMRDTVDDRRRGSNKIDDAVLKKVAKRIAAIRAELHNAPPASDISSPFRVEDAGNGKTIIQISPEDLKTIYSKPRWGIDRSEEIYRSGCSSVKGKTVKKPEAVREEADRVAPSSDQRKKRNEKLASQKIFQPVQSVQLQQEQDAERILQKACVLAQSIQQNDVDNYWRAKRVLANTAKNGPPELQFALYHAYKTGAGIEHDILQSAQWLLRAANGGHDEALKTLEHLEQGNDEELRFTVSEMYWRGMDPLERDPAIAAALSQGPDRPAFGQALLRLGDYFAARASKVYFGVQASTNYKQIAAKYYLRAITQGGNADAKLMSLMAGSFPSEQYNVVEACNLFQRDYPENKSVAEALRRVFVGLGDYYAVSDFSLDKPTAAEFYLRAIAQGGDADAHIVAKLKAMIGDAPVNKRNIIVASCDLFQRVYHRENKRVAEAVDMMQTVLETD